MSVVGIAEFKARLSQYLRQAQAGETVTITDRGVPVAELNKSKAAPRRSVGREPTIKPNQLRPPEFLDLGELDPVALLLEMRQRDR